MTEPREKRRTALLRAARDVFVTHGYQDARIEQIARKAGVGKGTFYLYFKDKRAIYAELVDGLFQRLRAAILDVDSKGDIESQVRHNIRALIAVITAMSARMLWRTCDSMSPLLSTSRIAARRRWKRPSTSSA